MNEVVLFDVVPSRTTSSDSCGLLDRRGLPWTACLREMREKVIIAKMRSLSSDNDMSAESYEIIRYYTEENISAPVRAGSGGTKRLTVNAKVSKVW